MNKKGIELSANFLVGMILGIALLGAGFAFLGNILNGTSKIESVLTPDFFAIEEEQCISDGEKVCVPYLSKTAQSGKNADFGIIINNNFGETKEFKVMIDFSRGRLEDGSDSAQQDVSDWSYKTGYHPVQKLDNNDHATLVIPFIPPKKTRSGSYVFNLFVCFNSDVNEYGECPSGHESLWDLSQVTVVVP